MTMCFGEGSGRLLRESPYHCGFRQKRQSDIDQPGVEDTQQAFFVVRQFGMPPRAEHVCFIDAANIVRRRARNATHPAVVHDVSEEHLDVVRNEVAELVQKGSSAGLWPRRALGVSQALEALVGRPAIPRRQVKRAQMSHP